MRIRSLGYLAGLGLIPVVWLAGDRKSPYPVAADLAMSAPMLVDAAGNSLGIYDAARIDDRGPFPERCGFLDPVWRGHLEPRRVARGGRGGDAGVRYRR